MGETSIMKREVKIPQDLYDDITKAVAGKGFSTVDDYVTYVLRITLGKKQAGTSDQQSDDENVMKQLKALGYI